MKLLIIVLLVASCFTKTCGNRSARTLANPLWNETVVDRLRNDLLTNYDRFARPSHHQESMNVTLGFDLYYLETDELNSTFSVAMGLRLYWGDPKLKWNPDDYDGSHFITMAEHEIWQPDLYLLNSASSGGEAVVRYSNALAVAHSDGIVQWVTPSRFTALCDFDLYYWPHDTQLCQLKFGSWSQSSRDLQLLLHKVSYEAEVDSGQWNITSSFEISSTQRDLYPDSFHQVVLNLTLVRKPSTMTTVISVTITTLTLLVLIQQFVVNKALVVPCLVSVGTSLCLLHFSTKVGATKNSAPWILSFFSTCLFLSTLSMLKLIILQKRRFAWIPNVQLQEKLKRALLLNDYVPNTEGEDGRKWELLATAVDRIFFLCYAFIFVVLFLAYFV